jgi:hypothetical protein
MPIEAGGAFVCNDTKLTEDDQHLWQDRRLGSNVSQV